MKDLESDETFQYQPMRLVEHSHLDAILAHNIANLDRWRVCYPNHEAWIDQAIKSIKRDEYSRLAFGVFITNGEHAGRLVCSAIVKKDPLGPYLEIKNLILMNTPESLSGDALRQHKQECYKRIIKLIQRFAESRGYSKLLTELSNRGEDERELIQAFLRCSFDVSGSQLRRYMQTDEFIILSFDVDPLYGLDPYDFEAATKWLVRRYLPEFEIVGSMAIQSPPGLELLVNGKTTIPVNCFELKSHRRDPQTQLKKFSMSCYVLWIESYLASNQGIADHWTVEPKFRMETHGPVYIFDFSTKIRSGSNIWERELFKRIVKLERASAYFDRQELNELLYGKLPKTENLRITADLPMEEVGGVLTLTDPDRLDGEKINANIENGNESIYVKLGPKGKCAMEGHILAFYFPSEESYSRAQIWGYAEISEVQYFNIATIPPDHQGRDSDAGILFRHIEEALESHNAVPLWTKEQFEKHNKFNATNEVVLFYLHRFVDLRERRLKLEHVVRGQSEQDRFRRRSIEKEIDAYISQEEARVITDLDGEAHANRFDLPGLPHRVLCVWSQPDDMGRIENDGAKLDRFLSDRSRFEVSTKHNPNYAELKDLLRTNSPNLIHFCGHATPDGLIMAGSKGSWRLDKELLKSALEAASVKPFLVVFNCCWSDGLADAVSAHGFAIGFSGELGEEYARDFPDYYSSVLVKGYTTASLKGKLVDVVDGFAAEKGAKPTLWYRGEKLR